MFLNKTINSLRKCGVNITFNRIFDSLIAKHYGFINKIRWTFRIKNRNFSGVTSEKRTELLVLSLTTYPARINTVDEVIKSLLLQTVKPDLLILWLAEEQFPNKENDLPDSLLKLKKYGLSIRWCRDMKSYKKLIPALVEYPDAAIITADDDMYYRPKMVEKLYKAYLKDSSVLHCHRVTKFYMENGEFKTIAGGYEFYKKPSYLNKLTGGSGTCYPPHSLFQSVTDMELFMKLAPTNDDIWFWLMGALNGMKCNVVKGNYAGLYFVENSQNTALFLINDRGEKLFWKQFESVLNYFPDLKKILNSEWEKEEEI